jgi:translation initiation factor IF-3
MMVNKGYPRSVVACDLVLARNRSNSLYTGILRRHLMDCSQNNGNCIRTFNTSSVLLLSKGIHDNPRNQNIKARSVLLIDSEGEKLGTMTTREALDKAKEQSLHVVQIQKRQGMKPAICKLYSPKMIFDSEKKAKHSPQGSKLKELKITGRIAPQDLKWKSKKMYDFLENGNSVKLSITRKPYQKITHEEKMEIVKKVIEEVKEVGIMVGEPKVIGALALRCNFKPTLQKDKTKSL